MNQNTLYRLLYFILLSGINYGFAQNSRKNPEDEEKKLLLQDKEMRGSCCNPSPGTYQFINKKGTKENFSDDEMEVIKKTINDRRKQNEIIFLPVGKNTRLKILSNNEISSPGFVPVGEFMEEE